MASDRKVSNGVFGGDIHASGLVLSLSWAVWVSTSMCGTEIYPVRESGGHLKAMRHPMLCLYTLDDVDKISRYSIVQGTAC